MTTHLYSRWQIDGVWLVSQSGARLARVVLGGIALYDKHAHDEVVLTAADLETILRNRPLDSPSASVTLHSDLIESN